MADKLKIIKTENVQVLAGGDISVVTLHITQHHLILVQSPPPVPPGDDPPKRPAKARESWIAYPMIALCTYRPTAPGSGFPSSIRIRCRDFMFITLNFTMESKARDVYESIKNACILPKTEKLYSFSFQPVGPEKEINGWEIYDAKAEWRRQGISDKGADRGWRISKINMDYGFSPTYPALLPVPSTISDNTLNYAGRYRSRVRIPVLTYLHPVNNCSVTRSAQPIVGLRGNRSIQDEKLVSACFSASAATDSDLNTSTNSRPSPESSQSDLDHFNSEAELFEETEKLEDELIASTSLAGDSDKPHIYGAQKRNLIVDARPTVNALAMQAVGLGSENMDHYKFATKAYLGIDNIHVMRESLAKVIEALKDSDISKLPPNRELLAKSGWLKHITGLLDGSALIARQVGIQHSHVLIHCSDGWDRTSQLSALSQMMLDPYFRTIDGFIVLVEKDWLSFGHMFQHRSGYLSSPKWFKTQNDALAGTTIQPGNNTGSGPDALENALLSAKRFFKQEKKDEGSEGEGKEEDEAPKGLGKETKEATDLNNISPTFHQFLDATYQLLRQFPTRFEFNERFLRRLLYHLYSCQYGTFLYNCEKQRLDNRVQQRTHSVWSYFLSRRKEFTNPQFDSEIDDNVRGKERLIFPALDKVRWWHELFSRSDEDMNGLVNLQTERYLARESSSVGDGGAGSGLGKGVLTGVESAHAALTVGSGTAGGGGSSGSRSVSNGGDSGRFASLREGIAGLGIGKGKGLGMGSGSRSPRNGGSGSGDGKMEVEMQ